jgi:hypothetical protein
MTRLSCVSVVFLGLATAALGASAPAKDRQLNEDTPGELSFQCSCARGFMLAFAKANF